MKHLLLLAAATAIASISFAQQPKNESYDAFLKRNPDARNLHWQDNGKRIIVELKSGKKEVYDLSVDSQRLAAMDKYGALPEAPPPPPAPPTEESPAPPPVPEIAEQAPSAVIQPLRAAPPSPPSIHKTTSPSVKKMGPPPPLPKKDGPSYN